MGRIRAFAALGVAILGVTGCGGGDSQGARIWVIVGGASNGRAEVTVAVGGEETTSEVGVPYQQEIEVDGEFDVVVTARTITDKAVRCRIDPPFRKIAEHDEGDVSDDGAEVECEMSGSVDGTTSRFDVTQRVVEAPAESTTDGSPSSTTSSSEAGPCDALYQQRADLAVQWAEDTRTLTTDETLDGYLSEVNDELAAEGTCSRADANDVLCTTLETAFADDANLEVYLGGTRDEICT